MTASEYSGRVFQAQLGERLGVEVVLLGNTQFLYIPRLRRGERACPFNFLYWTFLIKHEQVLRGNPRMGPNVLSLRHVGADEQSSSSSRQKSAWQALASYREDRSARRKLQPLRMRQSDARRLPDGESVIHLRLV